MNTSNMRSLYSRLPTNMDNGELYDATECHESSLITTEMCSSLSTQVSFGFSCSLQHLEPHITSSNATTDAGRLFMKMWTRLVLWYAVHYFSQFEHSPYSGCFLRILQVLMFYHVFLSCVHLVVGGGLVILKYKVIFCTALNPNLQNA